jgi:hypothetical protein
MPPRKIVSMRVEQVSNDHWNQCHFFYFALCDDGTMWVKRDNDTAWSPEPIPGAADIKE